MASGGQATSPVSPGECWWESPLQGEQVKVPRQKSNTSRSEVLRKGGRSEEGLVKTGSELRLEVATWVWKLQPGVHICP